MGVGQLLVILMCYELIDETVSQGSTNNGMNLRSGSRFYTPATPNTCFDPMNITDCINSSKETFTEQSLFIFQLPGKCYGNILSMQMCLLVDMANVMLSLPVIRVTLYVQDGDHIIYSNNMVNISDMEVERMCQPYPEFMGFICCFNYTFNVMLNNTDSTFIGLETLQSTVRLIHSKILSNVTICLNGLSMQNFPSCNCYLSEIFLLTVRAEIASESENCSVEPPTASESENYSVETPTVSQESTINGMNLRSGCRFYTPATPNTCFDPMIITDCITTPKEMFIEQSLFIFQLPGKCYGNILSMRMCLLVDVANVMLSLPVIRVSLYVQDGDHIIYSNNMVNISDMEVERMCQRYPEFMGFICCFNYTFNVMLNHTDSTFIGIETLQSTVHLIRSNILSNVTICPNGLSMQNFPSCNCYLSEIFLLSFRAEIGESGNCSVEPPTANNSMSTETDTGTTSMTINPTTTSTTATQNGNTPSRTLGSSLGGVFIALAILVLSGILLAWFIWSMKYKKKKIILASRAQNIYRTDVAATNYAVGYNKESNFVNMRSDDTSEYEHLMEEDEDTYIVPPFEEEALYAQMENNQIEYLDRTSLKLETMLGSGQFGEVYKGLWLSPDGDVEVAVKSLKKGANNEEKVKFLQEVAIMGQFKDPNVVTMYGVVTAGEPILLVLELLPKGDLRNNLLKSRSDNSEQIMMDGHTLLSYCRQVVSGMAYLSGKKFVHRDLAARNILVTKQGICKIADFGMARNILYESFYTSHGGMIPVKWTAPEALHYKMYTTASDIWSFGVVMYEIWSVGHKPFEELKNKEVLCAIDSGFRLPPPPGCPRSIYSLMINCWNPESSKRPSFLNVRNELSLPDPTLLQWNEEDSSGNQEGLKLGGSIKSAQGLYMDLQNTYKSSL